MGRPAKPPRLWLDPTRGQWIIRDGSKFVRLGTADRARAETALAGYIARKPAADKKERVSRAGTVYVIRIGPYVKIGFTRQALAARLKPMKVSMPEPPVVVAEIPGSRRDELSLHHHFAEHRLNGEWFRIAGAVEEWISAGCPAICAESVPEKKPRWRPKHPNLLKYGA